MEIMQKKMETGTAEASSDKLKTEAALSQVLCVGTRTIDFAEVMAALTLRKRIRRRYCSIPI